MKKGSYGFKIQYRNNYLRNLIIKECNLFNLLI